MLTCEMPVVKKPNAMSLASSSYKSLVNLPITDPIVIVHSSLEAIDAICNKFKVQDILAGIRHPLTSVAEAR